MSCCSNITFRKPSCDAVHVDRLPETGISGLLYVTGDTESAAVYAWVGDKFVLISADCPPTPAYSTVIGANGEYTPDPGYYYDHVTVEVPTPIMDTLFADTNGTFHAPEGYAYDEVIVDVTRLIEGYVDFRVINQSNGMNMIVAVPTDDGSKPGPVPLHHFWVESNETEIIPVPIIHGEAYVYFHQNGQPPHYPILISQSYCTYDPNTGSARADNPLDGRICELVMRY